MVSAIEYRRGLEVLNITATVGKTDYEVEDENGIKVGAEVRDFLITAADLPFTPESGDVVVFEGRTFEVMNLTGQGCWRYSDPFHQTLRVHTRQTG